MHDLITIDATVVRIARVSREHLHDLTYDILAVDSDTGVWNVSDLSARC